MAKNKAALVREIIRTGKTLYGRQLVVGTSGNISCRLNARQLLITGTSTCLGDLKPADIVVAGVDGAFARGGKRPSSELPLHAMIYRNLPVAYVIHCHPALTNAYFSVRSKLEEVIFETKHCLGNVPVIPQTGVNVTDPAPVIAALKRSPLVVLKNHGVVAVGASFNQPLYLTETLESAVKIAAVARLFADRSFRP